MVDQVELRSELLELAERCEQATGPDIDLDLAISEATKAWKSQPTWKQFRPTTSLDAAMTLAPKGRYAMVIRQAVDACLRDVRHIANAFEQRLPAFICAAALRARTPTTPERSDD